MLAAVRGGRRRALEGRLPTTLVSVSPVGRIVVVDEGAASVTDVALACSQTRCACRPSRAFG